MRRKYSQGECNITLQTLIDDTIADKNLSDTSRRNRVSMLRTFARIVGKPPGGIAAVVEELRAAIALANPGPAGIGREYWGMCCSTVWWALERAGVTVIRATGTQLPPELANAVAPLPWRPHRLTLSPLLKFFVEHNIDLALFDQGLADQFRDWMRQSYRKRAWQKPYRRAIEMFTRCGREFPALWPPIAIEIRFDDDHYTLGWKAFPDLEVEVDAVFTSMMASATRRSKTPNRKPIRASTAGLRKYYVLRAASAIAIKDKVPPSTIRCLRQVINPEAVEKFIDFVVARRGGADRTGDLSQAVAAFNVIARHHLELPVGQIDELVNIRRTLLPRQGPAEKNKQLMDDFRSSAMRLAFVRMPYRVLDRLTRKETLTDRDREEGELAFVTAFLTCAPLRISEYLALDKVLHIVDRGTGKHRSVVVSIPGDVRKVDDRITFKLSPRVARIMDVYWKRFRRGTNCKTSLRVIPGFKKAGRNPHHLSQQLARFTARELGRRITAHQFRVLVGYIFLKRNPGCYEAVRRFLGHKSIRTTMLYYAFMLEEEAFEDLDSTIDKLLGD